MNKHQTIKQLVKEKYSRIARGEMNICEEDSTTCADNEYSSIGEDYSHLPGYQELADMNLGCGLPTQFAKIQAAQTVLDLGSGTGNDCFIARRETGENGHVIGVDFSEDMVNKAKDNAKHLGFSNVEFKLGDIEALPVATETIDVVVSNCVLNLVPDKEKAFSEVYRVLRNGGHFSIADIVVQGPLPSDFQAAAEQYAGCVAGAIQLDDYLDILSKQGFEEIQIQKLRPIQLSVELWKQFFTEEQIKEIPSEKFGIYSLTVFAQKPRA